MAVCVQCFILKVPWVGLWSVIVAFPGDNYLLFSNSFVAHVSTQQIIHAHIQGRQGLLSSLHFE